MKVQRKVGEIKKEIDELTKKIVERIRELGQVDVMTYRGDRVIGESMDKICELYREGFGICEHYDNSSEPVCKLFRDEPAIIKQLELSEEIYCPVNPKPKKT